ncbi:MAG: lysylphosphatidylglycerol synthase transmembrane domain-containing protein, partial [Fibrobacterota bacterium]|nr:lysylphosphatidylglycerol synthase transmembrane domain-containing protein [Chitinispirillaceae bacterium]
MINIPILNRIPQKIIKPLTQILKISVTILVVYIVVKKLGWENIVTTFKKTNLLYAFYGLLCCVVSIFLGALQWHLLMHRKEVKIPYRETFELYYIGMFFNNIGTLAGDTIKVAYIKSRHSHGKLGFAATFLDRFAGLLALTVFAGAGCLYMVTHGELHTDNELLIAKVVMGLVCMMGVMLPFLLMRRLRRLVTTIIEKLPIPKKQLLNDVVA